jgi:hypothetical protein
MSKVTVVSIPIKRIIVELINPAIHETIHMNMMNSNIATCVRFMGLINEHYSYT